MSKLICVQAAMCACSVVATFCLSVCLFVWFCLSVCQLYNWESYELILMQFCGGLGVVQGGTD